MPQFNPHTSYQPNEEIRRYNGEYYRLTPTNVADTGTGYVGIGGKVEKLGALNGIQLKERFGYYPGDIFNMVTSPEDYASKNKYSQSDIQSGVQTAFSGMDPNNKTGWQGQMKALTKQASDLYNADPTQQDKVFGATWNAFRANPANASGIQAVQAGKTTALPAQPYSKEIDQAARNADAATVQTPAIDPSAPAGGINYTVVRGDTQQTQQQSQLPQSVQEIVLEILAEQAAKNPIPKTLEISPQVAASYLQQAKNRVEPEYKQYFDQAIADVQTGFRQLGEDVLAQERTLESKYGSQLGSLQENLARRGLTFSTERTRSEKSLAESTQAAIDAGRREAERKALTLGSTAERQIGSANLPLLPGINEPPKPILDLPGQYVFSKPTGTRSLYTPVPGTTGQLEYKKQGAIADLYNTYLTGERELRGGISA